MAWGAPQYVDAADHAVLLHSWRKVFGNGLPPSDHARAPDAAVGY
jgi:hypothetical protein